MSHPTVAPSALVTNMKFLAIAISLFAVVGCRSLKEGSSVQYAYSPAERVFGSPLGRLVAQGSGIKNDLIPQKICVEEPPAPLTAAEFLYETELAYIMWLQAAGVLDINGWKTLQFETKSVCPDQDPSYAAYAIIGRGQGDNIPAALKQTFNEPKITCDMKPEGNAKRLSCATVPITLGLGAFGNIVAYFFQNAPDKWVELKAGDPARLALSPFVTWHSLAAELENATRTGSAATVAQNLAKEWRAIVDSGQHDFAKLSGFAAKLAQAKIVALPEPNAQKMMRDFFQSSDPQPFSKSYQPVHSTFHTLVHEIGHQLGMDHADAPDKTSVTGASSANGQINADGQWVTKEATMAYGEAYLYLTPDDREGIAAQVKEIRAFYAKHK